MVGTIVTRHLTENGLDCDKGTCVGKIVDIDSLPPFTYNPQIAVEWYETCEYHNYDLNVAISYDIPELWEIGQIPRR